MIPNNLGQSLHDRRTRGETLSDEEKEQLRQWYDRLDQEETARLQANPAPDDDAQLESQMMQTAARIAMQAQRIQGLIAENAGLQREVAALQRRLAARSAEQPA